MIIDNLDSEFETVGYWNRSSNSRYPYYGSDFRYTQGGSGDKQAIFTPYLPYSGDYLVQIWYFTKESSGTNVPHTINYSGGSETILVNRQGETTNGYWQSLGIYPFDEGTTGNLTITDNADVYVEADAVRFILQ